MDREVILTLLTFNDGANGSVICVNKMRIISSNIKWCVNLLQIRQTDRQHGNTLEIQYPRVFRLEVGRHNSQASRHIWSSSLEGNKLSQDTVVNRYKYQYF